MTTAAISTSLDRPTRMWRYRVFGATWVAYAAFYFCRKPFYIAKSSIGEAFSIDASLLGWMGLAYLLAYTIGQFVAGWSGNRVGPRILLLVGMAVSIGCNVVFGLTNSWQTMTAFLFLNGLAQATGWPGGVGAMAPWFHRRERGTVMGLWATNFQAGGVLANMGASFVLAGWGWRWSFFAGSVVLAVAWLLVLVLQRNRPEDVGLPPIHSPEPEDDRVEDATTEEVPGEQAAAPWTRDTRINVAMLGVFYFFVKFIRYAVWSWVPYMLYVSYGLEKDDAGYLSTVFDAAGIFGVIALGILSDRVFGGRRVGLSFVFILGMALSCVALYLLGPTSLAMFGVCVGLIGFCLYGPDAILTSAGAIDVGSREKATLAAGIINGMGSVGAMVQEVLLGRILGEGNVAGVFATLLLSAVLSWLCLGVLIWRNRQGRADL